MCTLIAELIMLVGGIYALISGKLKLTKNLQLEGTRARVAGIILALPLPLSLISGVIVGVLISMGYMETESVITAGLIEIVLVLAGLAGAFLYAYLTQPKDEGGVQSAIDK